MRLLHFLYAFVCGYWWLPCPICGRGFGAHESADESLMRPGTNFGAGESVCRLAECVAEARKRNMALGMKEGWWKGSWGPPPWQFVNHGD